MNLKINKQDFKKLTLIGLPLFIIVVISIILLSNWAISLKNKPTKEEQFSIFASVNYLNDEALKDRINGSLSKIKEYKVHYISQNDNKYSSLYSIYGAGSSDILILGESLLDDQYVIDNFLEIRNSYFYMYSVGETNYGIKLYDKESKEGILKNIFAYENDSYYMFVDKSSVHYGLSDNIAYDVIEELIK